MYIGSEANLKVGSGSDKKSFRIHNTAGVLVGSAFILCGWVSESRLFLLETQGRGVYEIKNKYAFFFYSICVSPIK